MTSSNRKRKAAWIIGINVLLAGLLVAALAAFSPSQGAEEAAAPEQDKQCYSNTDCPDHQTCWNSKCTACLKDAECRPGQFCEAGQCKYKGGGGGQGKITKQTNDSCSSTLECPDTDTCWQGKCTGCLADNECRNGQFCENKYCKWKKGNQPGKTGDACFNVYDCPDTDCCWNGKCTGCLADNECRPGQKCENKYCVWNDGGSGSSSSSGGSSGSCKSNTDCPDHQTCWNATCTSCIKDEECRPGQYCESGQCKYGKKQDKCKSNTDCPDDKTCWNGTCTACIKDAECRPGQYCDAGKCVYGKKNNACKSNTDCPDHQTCWNAKCTSCIKDAECRPGQYCQDGKCLYK